MTEPDTGKPVRVGVIGCGYWGRHYLRHFSSIPGAVLSAAADPDPECLARARDANPDASCFADHAALLSSNTCDAVVVATEASLHEQIITMALESGHDVLAEKPLSLTVQSADAMVAAAEKNGRMLMVAHTFLFNSGVLKIKEYIDSGVLGDIYYAKARRTHLGPVRDDVSALWDLAPHDISILLYLLGELPTNVQAMGRKMLRSDRHDVAFVNLRFPSNVVAHIHVSWADANKERYLDLVGSNARVVFDDLSVSEPVRLFRRGISVDQSDLGSFGEFKYLLRDGEIVSPNVPVKEPLRVLCGDFLDSVNTRKPNFSDGAFGRDVVSVLADIQSALEASDAMDGGRQ